jgi:hypothetical protein
MTRVRSRRVGRTGSILTAALGLFLGAASCGNLIGLEEWKEPTPAPDSDGGGGSQAGSGGAGGDPGAGGAGGAGTSSSSGGAGGAGGAEASGGPLCEACQASCAAEIDDCEDDASCNQSFRSCMFDLGPCCEANGVVWFGPLAQAAYECLMVNCAFDCNLNPHCADCILNGSESDVDCGGDACLPCQTGKKCGAGFDCESGMCSANGTCM